MVPSKGRSYTIRAEDGTIREMSSEELLSKMVRKSRKRASARNRAGSSSVEDGNNNISGQDRNSNNNNGGRGSAGSPAMYHHRHPSPSPPVALPSRVVSVPHRHQQQGNSSSCRRTAPVPEREDEEGPQQQGHATISGMNNVVNHRTPENGRRDPSVGEEKRDPPASRREYYLQQKLYQRQGGIEPRDEDDDEDHLHRHHHNINRAEPPAWDEDESQSADDDAQVMQKQKQQQLLQQQRLQSQEQRQAVPHNYHHHHRRRRNIVDGTPDSVESKDRRRHQEYQQQKQAAAAAAAAAAYSEVMDYRNGSPSPPPHHGRSKPHPVDFHQMINRTNSTTSYTVNTEKEGPKLMSQAEISRLVRSSIMKARQQGPQPAAKVFKSLAELSPAGAAAAITGTPPPDAVGGRHSPPGQQNCVSPLTPRSQVSQTSSFSQQQQMVATMLPQQLQQPQHHTPLEPQSARYLWPPTLPDTNVDQMVAPSFADCTEPSQLTEPSALLPHPDIRNPRNNQSSGNRGGGVSPVDSVARTELYEEIRNNSDGNNSVDSNRNRSTRREHHLNQNNDDQPEEPRETRAIAFPQLPTGMTTVSPLMPQVVQGETVTVIEAEVVEEIPNDAESLREDLSQAAEDYEAANSYDEDGHNSDEQNGSSSQEKPGAISVKDEDDDNNNNNVDDHAGDDENAIRKHQKEKEEESIQECVSEIVSSEDHGQLERDIDEEHVDEPISPRSDGDGETEMDVEEPEEEGNSQLKVKGIIDMSDSDIAELVHKSMDKAHTSARKEVQDLLQHSKRKKNTIEVKTAEGRKVMSQREVADLVKESMRRARESAQEEIANLVKDSVRLARESAQEEIRSMVQESMVRARESAQREMSEMIRESLQRARLSDASASMVTTVSTMTNGGYSSLMSPTDFAANATAATPVHNDNHDSSSPSQIPVVQGFDHLKALSEEDHSPLTAPPCESPPKKQDSTPDKEVEDQAAASQSVRAKDERASPDVFFGIEDLPANRTSSDPIERSRKDNKRPEATRKDSPLEKESVSQKPEKPAATRKDSSSEKESVSQKYEKRDTGRGEIEVEQANETESHKAASGEQHTEVAAEGSPQESSSHSHEATDKEERSAVADKSASKSIAHMTEDGHNKVQSAEEGSESQQAQQGSTLAVSAGTTEGIASSGKEDRKESQPPYQTPYGRMRDLEKARKKRIKMAAMALMKKREETGVNKKEDKIVKKKRRSPRQRRERSLRVDTSEYSSDDSHSPRKDNLAPFSPAASAMPRNSSRHRERPVRSSGSASGSKSTSSCSSAAVETAVEAALETASIAAETVVTDQFLAQIASKKGRKVTAEELTKMMQTQISNRVECVLSPSVAYDIRDQDTEDEDDDDDDDRKPKAEDREEEDEDEEDDVIHPDDFSEKHAKSGFCLSLMELLTINEEPEESSKSSTANGKSEAGGTAWIDSLAEDMSSTLDNNGSVDFYTEGEGSTTFDQGESDHGETTFDQDDVNSTFDNDSARDSYRYSQSRILDYGRHSRHDSDDNSSQEHSGVFDDSWWTRKKDKLRKRRQEMRANAAGKYARGYK